VGFAEQLNLHNPNIWPVVNKMLLVKTSFASKCGCFATILGCQTYILARYGKCDSTISRLASRPTSGIALLRQTTDITQGYIAAERVENKSYSDLAGMMTPTQCTL
jgi:hypothetical protein